MAGHPDGLTVDAAAAELGLPYVSLSTRASELLADEWLIRTDRTRATSSGGEAAVLVATASALQALGRSVAA